MLKILFHVSIIVLLSFSYTFAQSQSSIVAQQQKAIVDSTNAVAFGIQSAQLNKVVLREGDKWETKLQLSFLKSDALDKLPAKTWLVLTAFNETGAIIGMHYWCPSSIRESLKKSSDNSNVVFDVNSKLEGAYRYAIALNEPGPTDCPACVSLAEGACGKGNIQSVNCSADGGCSFTCK